MGENEPSDDSAKREVAPVSVKLPPLWQDNIELWFLSVESQFVIAGISREITKFHYVVSAIDCNVLKHVSDFLTSDPTTLSDPYSQLKLKLISQFKCSDSSRLRKLLAETELGDRKPSELLREMQALAGGKLDDSILKVMWMQHLPLAMQQILSARSDPIAELALAADNISEVSNTSNTPISPISDPSCSSDTRFSSLERQISELTEGLKGLQRSYGRYPRRRNGFRSRSPSRDSSMSRWCWYHRNFKDRARKCLPNCEYELNQEN